jgi:hypothetical protein
MARYYKSLSHADQCSQSCCLAVATNSGHSPSSRFPNCPRASDTSFSLLTTVTLNWLSQPLQSSKLLLALASTVVLGFGPRQDPWPYICPFHAFTCFEMGPPLWQEEESVYYWSLPATGEWLNNHSPYVAPVPTAQKTCLPLLHVFSFQGKQRVDRAVP